MAASWLDAGLARRWVALILRAEHAAMRHGRQLCEHAGRLTLLAGSAVSAPLMQSWLMRRSRDRGDRSAPI